MSGLWASRYGTAPMWSSWPWVSTIAWTSSSRSRIGREVGQDQVDAGLVDVGEQHAAVDDQQLAVVLEDGHVAADGAEPAERDDPQAAVGQRRRRRSVPRSRTTRSRACRPHLRVPRVAAVSVARASATGACVSSGRGAAVTAGRAGAASPRAAGRSRPRSRRPAASGPGRPADPSGRRPALTRIAPWVRKMPVNSGSSSPVQRERRGDVAALVRLDHAAWSAAPMKWVEVPTTPTAADRQQRQGQRVVAAVEGEVGAGGHPARSRPGRPWRP